MRQTGILLCLVMVLVACSDAQEGAAEAAEAPLATLAPSPALPPGLVDLLMPHWGASPYWERGTEQRLYFGTTADGDQRFAWEERLVLAGQGTDQQAWIWTSNQAAGSTMDSVLEGPASFALRAKRDRHTSPLSASWLEGQMPWEDDAVPANLLPFWLRQMAFHPGLEGSFRVQPQHGSILPTGPDAFAIHLSVGAPDSIAFQGEQWATWPVECRIGDQTVANIWFERRYPNGLVRWENLRGDTRQLRTARQLVEPGLVLGVK